jgi:ubiquinone/menaquinone biosynthesis C-methylase UbiE
MGPMSTPGPAARPFYGSFAWAYDLISERAVATECAQIEAMLAGRGLAAGARLLDAGCGTGRYAVELARRGFRVTGVDAAAELLAVARRQAGADTVTLVHGDLRALPASSDYDAILCRGVLNDLVEDRARREAFLAFGRALTRGGALVLDVREWETTERRKTMEPVLQRTLPTAHGTLTYRSETRLDRVTRQLRIAEHHVLTDATGTTVADYDFFMRCWTRDELDRLLAESAFTAAEYAGAYDRAVPVGATDRLVVAATRA